MMPSSNELTIPFDGRRLSLPFQSGFLFYATWQIRLLIQMLRTPCGAIWANDLDTLLPAYLAAKWHGVPLVYDSHEFFTEAAGLTGRPLQRNVWLNLERWLFPRIASIITVNDSIAEAYEKRYPNARSGKPLVVRNMPLKRTQTQNQVDWRTKLEIPEAATFAILQGAYLDKDRGVIQAVEALRLQPHWYLAVVGAGEEFEWAQQQQSALNGRLICLPKMPFNELCTLTAAADLGFSLDRGVHGNYWFSLPNKLFDYIHAGIPIVASPMPEVRRIVEEWNVGVVIRDHGPESIAEAVTEVMNAPRTKWSDECAKASKKLNWQAESDVIAEAIAKAMSNN
jgi:glycosyltransferase involved in cell wall biosynthesis